MTKRQRDDAVRAAIEDSIREDRTITLDPEVEVQDVRDVALEDDWAQDDTAIRIPAAGEEDIPGYEAWGWRDGDPRDVTRWRLVVANAANPGTPVEPVVTDRRTS